jgi:hypothetical protein
MHSSPHVMEPSPHWHADISQMPPKPQLVPHSPQLNASELVSTQNKPQRV